jgi:hypothetical protein
LGRKGVYTDNHIIDHFLFFVYVIGLSTASCSSAEMVTVGQIGNYGYGSVPMEKSFRVSLRL